jgi:23S rRNA pseudouridine2605 synthase
MPQERLQKILAAAGLGSRREAEEWIAEGRVRVNGAVVTLGDRADPERDSVKFDGRPVRPRRTRRYLLLNKPRGYITTTDDPERRQTVLDLVPEGLRGLKPIGRLDVQSEGLLILTDDGDFAQAVSHPSRGVGKEYEVKVSGVPTEAELGRVRRGLPIDGRRAAPCQIDRMRRTRGPGEGNTWLRVVLHEGRSRQVRRMFEMIGHSVLKLRRTAIGPLRDPRLRPGEFRPLTEGEVARLKAPASRRPGTSPRRGRTRG